MLKSKEEFLKNLDSSYRRIVISSDNFATKAFEKILNEEPKEDWKIRTYDFIKKYQDSSLFINCESLLLDYDVKIFLSIVLSALTDNETEFYLYLFAPENEIAALREKLEVVYNYKKDWITYIYDSFEDDGYVIEIRDNRYFATNSFFKIYPDGEGILVTDCDYNIEKTNFAVPEDLCKELNCEAKKKVKKAIKEQIRFICDDREFLKSFIVVYGFEWLGHHHSWDVDYKDYFLKKYPMKVIEKLMKIPVIKEKFKNATIPSDSQNRFEADI